MKKLLFLLLLFSPLAKGQATHTTVTIEDNQTIIGNKIFTGNLSAKNFETIRFADNYSGSDWCTQANNADLDIGANPGEIWIVASKVASLTCAAVLTQSASRIYRFVNGGTYSVPFGDLVFTKPSLLDGGSLSGTILNFTGGSGIAINIQWNTVSTGSYQDWSMGVRNIQLIGPAGISGTVGYAGTAFSIGASGKSSLGVLIDNVLVAGFSLGQTWGDTTGLSWGTKTRYTAFYNNAQSVLFNAPNEVVNYDTVTFSPNASNGYQASCFSVTSGANGGEASFINSHFDACQFNAVNGVFTFDALTHFENVNTNTTNPFMVFNGGGTGYLNGTQFIQTRVSGSVPPEFVQCVGAKVTNSGASFFSNFTMVNAVLLDTSCEYHQMGSTTVGGVTTPIGNTAGWTGSATYDNSGTGAAAPSMTVSASGTNSPGYQLSRGSTTPVISGVRMNGNCGVTNCLELFNNGNVGFRADDNGNTIIPAGKALNFLGNLNVSSLLISNTAPTIAGAGCGGTVAAIQNANGTASFEIFTGTAPTSAGCTVTFPAAAHHWICPTITHTSAVSTTNFIILQTGALSSTSVTFQLFSDVAAATAPTASDTWAVSGCHAN